MYKKGNDMRYYIYQIKDIATCNYAFQGWKEARESWSLFDYKPVWCGKIKGKPEEVLEELFVTFNVNRPKNFRGHSLSVSDVVVLNKGNYDVDIYYCDDFGWKEIGR